MFAGPICLLPITLGAFPDNLESMLFEVERVVRAVLGDVLQVLGRTLVLEVGVLVHPIGAEVAEPLMRATLLVPELPLELQVAV